MENFRLPAGLAAELCRHLGVDRPATPADLAPLYRAWCARVSFDNIGKHLAIAEGRVPPGDDPAAVVESFLATGLGGTCWAHVSALAGLLGEAGADVTVALDRMDRTDGVVDFHSFVVVHDAGRRLALDPVWVSGPPLPLEAGATGSHPVIRTGFDADGDHERLWHWSDSAGGERLRYAVLSAVLGRDDVAAFCAVSARHSGVPAGVLSVRRVMPETTISLRGPEPGSPAPTAARAGGPRVLTVRRRTSARVDEATFTDPDEAFAAVGCGPAARSVAERAGLLTYSLVT